MLFMHVVSKQLLHKIQSINRFIIILFAIHAKETIMTNPCLTRGQKQELILKKLLIKIDRPTIKQAMAELLFYEAYKGGILDIKG